MQSFNPYAASSPVAPSPTDYLARIPRAPRTPSTRARLLVVNLGPSETALVLFGPILAIMGGVMVLALYPQAGIRFFPLTFAILGCGMVVSGIVRSRQRRRTFTGGTPTIGWIVSFGVDRRSSSRDRGPTVLAWAFDGPGGRFTGSISTFKPQLLGEQRVGGPVVVLYDPKNPRVNTLWVE